MSHPGEVTLFHHRNNIRYLGFLIGWAAHHDWVQVVSDSDKEDPRPQACFHPNASFNDFDLKKTGCAIYKSKATTLQLFMKEQVMNVSIRNGDVFALQAKVLSHVALNAQHGEDFRLKLLEKNNRHLGRKAWGDTPLLRHSTLQDDGKTDWDKLWRASRCIMPMYSELGVQGNFIEDHLRGNLRLVFSLPPENIISTPIKGVSSACGRLAVEKLIPMSLVPYDRTLYDGAKSFIRVLVHYDSWNDLGCSSTTGTKNCQSFPRCWQLAVKRVQGEHQECRPGFSRPQGSKIYS
jgi:hypothetical protein